MLFLKLEDQSISLLKLLARYPCLAPFNFGSYSSNLILAEEIQINYLELESNRLK